VDSEPDTAALCVDVVTNEVSNESARNASAASVVPDGQYANAVGCVVFHVVPADHSPPAVVSVSNRMSNDADEVSWPTMNAFAVSARVVTSRASVVESRPKERVYPDQFNEPARTRDFCAF
jgi:hypothetical protein